MCCGYRLWQKRAVDDACMLCAILEKLQCGGAGTASTLVVRVNIEIRRKYSTVEAAWFSWETIANIDIIELEKQTTN